MLIEKLHQIVFPIHRLIFFPAYKLIELLHIKLLYFAANTRGCKTRNK